MDIKAYLAEQGLTAEEIQAVIGNEKAAKAMSSALTRYEEGTNALTRAQAEKQETENYWTEKTQQLEGSVQRLTAAEKRAATAEAEAARVKAYNKSLADAGYDVPKEYYEGAPAGTTKPTESGNGQYLSREDAQKMMRGTAPDLVQLTALSNEYAYLYGKPYLSINEDFAEAQRQGKPLTDYARSKHGFDAKRAEILKAEDQKRIDTIVAEEKKKWDAEAATKYGSNPDTRTPMPSKFDRLAKREGFKSDSWKSEEGRQANRQDRLKRFDNIQIN